MTADRRPRPPWKSGTQTAVSAGDFGPRIAKIQHVVDRGPQPQPVSSQKAKLRWTVVLGGPAEFRLPTSGSAGGCELRAAGSAGDADRRPRPGAGDRGLQWAQSCQSLSEADPGQDGMLV